MDWAILTGAVVISLAASAGLVLLLRAAFTPMEDDTETEQEQSERILMKAEADLMRTLRHGHQEDKCRGTTCVMHNPREGAHRAMPLLWRDDRGIFERICDHGVGHPDPDQFEYWNSAGILDSEGIHGCDGCCSAWAELFIWEA